MKIPEGDVANITLDVAHRLGHKAQRNKPVVVRFGLIRDKKKYLDMPKT